MVDLLRRRGGHEALHVPLDDDSELPAAEEIEAGDARRDVMTLLAQLPERQRLPIQHVKLEGLSVLEAARLTGMSVSAIKVGVHRGLKALAARIRNEK
jgi:RNA polymerase sigma-70 factor (ECF subfamily)